MKVWLGLGTKYDANLLYTSVLALHHNTSVLCILLLNHHRPLEPRYILFKCLVSLTILLTDQIVKPLFHTLQRTALNWCISVINIELPPVTIYLEIFLQSQFDTLIKDVALAQSC